MKLDLMTAGMLGFAMLLSACSGNADPDGSGDSAPAEPFTLSVDKTQIESDGKDIATLVITDANGMELTDPAYIKKTSFFIEENNEWQSGMTSSTPNTFSSIADGTFTISAMYEGKECTNTVTVKSVNRRKYETFYKNVAIYRLTGTWCGYCPSMTEALGKINKITDEHSIVLEFHNGDDEFAVPYNASMDLAGQLMHKFAANGLPYAIYSLAKGSGDRKVTDIQDFIMEQLYRYPATTGIKATSSVIGNTVKINATVKASGSGKFELGAAILADNCIPSGNANESVYNGVVMGITGNYFAMSPDGSFELETDQEKQVEIVMNADVLTERPSDCRIVLFTLAAKGNGTIIDNAVEFKAGKSVDYRYN